MLVLIVKMNLIIPNPKTTNLLEDALIHSKLLPAVLREKKINNDHIFTYKINILFNFFSFPEWLEGDQKERLAMEFG